MGQTQVGAVPQGAKRTTVEVGGQWKDTPYFGPGLEKDTEHMKAFPVGMELAGVIKSIRTTKAEKEADRKDYLCMEDFGGNKFRVAAPGQLVHLAEQVGNNVAIVITYLGKETVEGYKQPLHQFKIERIEGTVN